MLPVELQHTFSEETANLGIKQFYHLLMRQHHDRRYVDNGIAK